MSYSNLWPAVSGTLAAGEKLSDKGIASETVHLGCLNQDMSLDAQAVIMLTITITQPGTLTVKKGRRSYTYATLPHTFTQSLQAGTFEYVLPCSSAAQLYHIDFQNTSSSSNTVVLDVATRTRS